MLSKTLALIQQEFAAHYDVTSTIRHKGEKGRQREHGLITLLREHLPMAYGVATGEIVPYSDAPNSPQCDIIIYDQLHYPILGRNDAVQQVPLEAVFSVIEVRSRLDLTALKDARKKFDAIKAMPRCASKGKPKKGKERTPVFVAFGYKMGIHSGNMHMYLRTVATDFLVIAMDSGFGLTLGDGKNERTIWCPTTSPHLRRYESLAWFYAILLQAMNNIDLGVQDYTALLVGTK